MLDTNSTDNESRIELSRQIIRLSDIVNKSRDLGITIKQIFGAIYAMLRWHKIGLESQSDSPSIFINALLEMDRMGNEPSQLKLSGFYRNDAAMRLFAGYERIHMLVWIFHNPKEN